MATDTIPADLPPMVEFKKKADKIIKERYGIEVEHIHAPKSYEKCFYAVWGERSNRKGQIFGFPTMNSKWCTSMLKMYPIKSTLKNNVSYIGIAADEPNRFHNLSDRKRSPLVEYGVTEAEARKICVDLDLLSPVYTQSARGGCWFCHNQSVQQLRLLRHQYPEYWALMLKWDTDSLMTFKPDGHTVHDFDKRFQLEDDGLLIANDKTFRWNMLNQELNYRLF
jgi:3'-phosphoadenosine 5'-phosphosulfate sulfotransferase (PAPS reductase)/FAD synthetase